MSNTTTTPQAEEVVRLWSMMNSRQRLAVATQHPRLAAKLDAFRDSLPMVRDEAMLEANHAVPRPDHAPTPARFNVLAAAAGESGWEAHPEAPADTPDQAGEMLTLDWAIVKATGQVLFYISEVEARRAYRTEHGRKIMTRVSAGTRWRVIS